jgi:tetratricopeptide (TPR) repeat protein
MSHDTQPTLEELLGRFLQRQAAAHECGLTLPESFGEVVPHDAAPVQPVDPRMAWDEALAAPRFFLDFTRCDTPPDWATLVVGHEPEAALAFAAGNFPQLVRNLLPLWQTEDFGTLRPVGGSAAPNSALITWGREKLGKQQFPQALVAIGALRLARQWESAEQLLRDHAAEVPAAWLAAWENERAALAWHRGQSDEAAKMWRSQADSVPVLFNRGMAALFLGRHAEARKALQTAVTELPEDGAWHHLGRLYLELAEMRRK